MPHRRAPRAALRLFPALFVLAAACAPLPGPEPEGAPRPSLPPAGEVVRLDAAAAARQADSLMRAVPAQAAPGLQISLWASSALIVDPTAITIDEAGDLYAVQTQRDGSVMDIRQNRDWYVPSLALQSIEERQAFFRRELAPERSQQNTARIRDLNRDGSHDWRDLTVNQERVWRIRDTDGDGRADFSQKIVEGFNSEVTEPAQGIQAFNGEIFLSVAPNVWRLRDGDGDGLLDVQDSISHGYNVKIGYGGHALDGIVVGPDGRLYFSVGDIGLSVTDEDGRHWQYEDRGSILRMNPDGSDFELFATGLRNVYDFAFDDYGNLIAADNDGDNAGENERIVYVTSGSDSGWRINWQFGKYSDPANNGYKPWMDEGMHHPDSAGQAAWFTPPVATWHSGPVGMVYNPGSALSRRWRNHFLVASSASRINAFTLQPKGAGFTLTGDTVLMTVGGVPTGIEFGPDGALYVADWIATFNPKGDGRIWRLDAPGAAATPERMETRALLASGFESRTARELRDLLAYPDQRVRQKAQFALARRGDIRSLLASARSREPQLARIHALWGIGQVARRDPRQAGRLAGFLRDDDAEIRAQGARVLGDVRHAPAGAALLPLLNDSSPRVRFFAAEALGRIRHRPAVQPLIQMLVENDDRDDYLRQAGATALERIGDAESLVALSAHPSRAARIAGVVALRRLRDARVAEFLGDPDEFVATEAAMAINDDGGIAGAVPALARLLDEPGFSGERLLRRAINANLLMGTAEAAERVARFAARESAPETMRMEALAVLGVWAAPSVLDRVDGVFRGGLPGRDGAPAQVSLLALVEPLFASGSSAVRVALVEALGGIHAQQAAPALVERVREDSAAEMRAAALTALEAMGSPSLREAVQVAVGDVDESVRAEATRILPSLRLPEGSTAELLARVVERGTVAEQQSAITALGKMRAPQAQEVLQRLVTALEGGTFHPGAELELKEAVEANGAPALQGRVQRQQATRAARGVVASFHDALQGGTATRGRQVVLQHTAAQCTRCHSLTEGGADVGPNLRGIGARLSREQILEALVDPSARIAPDYGTVSLTLTGGETLVGTLREETEAYVVVQVGEGEPRQIAKSGVARRVNGASMMPPMNALLTRREIRNVVEFLSVLR